MRRSSTGRIALPGMSLGLAWALFVCAGCSSNDLPPRPTPPRRLEADLQSARPRHDEQDYWTENLGHFFTARELADYWVTPTPQRFDSFGRRWLEFCLREDLLRGVDLSDEELDAFAAEPDYESSRRYLERILAGKKKSD